MNAQGKNVLLIGKYPPMQGGIATKTFWLYEKLAQSGFTFRVVTIETKNYSVPIKENDIKIFSVDTTSVPWHIPDSNLYFDRLLNKCFEALEDFTPDIIETNYLWPFCGVAIHLSKILNKPLLVRHAGSDILKFHTSNEFKNIMERYFEQSTVIVTNNTNMDIVSELCSDKTKIRLMDRYVPDPEYFRDLKYSKQYDILFAGKINYHWKLKGIYHLLEHIKINQLQALFLCDGNNIDDIYSLISEHKLVNNIEIKKFVHPSEMPEIISKCKSVWCWDEEGSIDDFSNIIWEAYYSAVPCFINYHTGCKDELKLFLKLHPELFIPIDQLNTNSSKQLIPAKNLDEPQIIKSDNKVKFTNYINQNIELYHSM